MVWAPPYLLSRGNVAGERLQASFPPVGEFYGEARSLRHELPGIALKIDLRGSGAGRAGARSTVVLASLGHAEAFLLVIGRAGDLPGRDKTERRGKGAAHGS